MKMDIHFSHYQLFGYATTEEMFHEINFKSPTLDYNTVLQAFKAHMANKKEKYDFVRIMNFKAAYALPNSFTENFAYQELERQPLLILQKSTEAGFEVMNESLYFLRATSQKFEIEFPEKFSKALVDNLSLTGNDYTFGKNRVSYWKLGDCIMIATDEQVYDIEIKDFKKLTEWVIMNKKEIEERMKTPLYEPLYEGNRTLSLLKAYENLIEHKEA